MTVVKRLPVLTHAGSRYQTRRPALQSIWIAEARFASQPQEHTPQASFENPPQRSTLRRWAWQIVQRLLGWLLPTWWIFRRNKVKPEEVAFVTAKGVQLDAADKAFLHRHKREILRYALKANENARKYRHLGNWTKDFRGASVRLENGEWATAVNLEYNHAKYTPCGERTGDIMAINQFIGKLSLRKLGRATPAKLEQIREGLKARLVVLCPDNIGRYAEVCPDCESMVACQEHFSPKTLFIAFGQDQTGKQWLRVQPLLQRQPYWQERVASTLSSEALLLDNLPAMEVSDKAAAVLAQKPWLGAKLLPMMKRARQAFLKNPWAEISRQNYAATVLVSREGPAPEQVKARMFTKARVDYKFRWHEPPDLVANAQGLQTMRRDAPDNVKTQAVAYYSQDPDIPYPSHLARIAQSSVSVGSELLVVTVNQDRLQLRTVSDLWPLVSNSNGIPGSTEYKFAVD